MRVLVVVGGRDCWRRGGVSEHVQKGCNREFDVEEGRSEDVVVVVVVAVAVEGAEVLEQRKFVGNIVVMLNGRSNDGRQGNGVEGGGSRIGGRVLQGCAGA